MESFAQFRDSDHARHRFTEILGPRLVDRPVPPGFVEQLDGNLADEVR